MWRKLTLLLAVLYAFVIPLLLIVLAIAIWNQYAVIRNSQCLVGNVDGNSILWITIFVSE